MADHSHIDDVVTGFESIIGIKYDDVDILLLPSSFNYLVWAREYTLFIYLFINFICLSFYFCWHLQLAESVVPPDPTLLSYFC